MKKERFYIRSRTLKLSVNCFFNYSFKQVESWLKKNDYPFVEEKYKKNTRGLYWVSENEKENNLIYGIWLPHFSLNREPICILSHELHHVVEAQAEEKALDCIETKAYLFEFYLDEILKKYKLN